MVPGQAEVTVSGKGTDGSVCIKDLDETDCSFPADGSNVKDGQTVNALSESGVMRGDMRGSFGALTGLAEGVPLLPDLTLVNVGAGCAPLAGHAIYLWHADARGRYSLYDVADQNYLRAVVVTDAMGRAQVQTIVPGCYEGRWPHIHFGVFAGLDAAVSGEVALLTSQFALPEATMAAVYADARYPTSTASLRRVTLATDMVFADNTAEQIMAQTLAMTGDATTFTGKGTVGIVVT